MKDEMKIWVWIGALFFVCGVGWAGVIDLIDRRDKRVMQETLDRIRADTKGTGIYHIKGGEVSCAWVGGINVGSCWPHQLELCPRLEPLE
ncbi:hypothetical protein SIID45300_01764 [Candidatus Magnetaquicoccaceae bacterium FCR-1]|uniref:Uncharacterized protein n=1 Tax=Candidatus Magnetaquiglobus chichijimensis TaxID=3141448 RepID=A0ABQ0C971_9PROT